MREFFIFITVVAAIAWVAALFFGSLIGIRKGFSLSPKVDKKQIRRIDEEMDKRTRDSRDQQRRLMQEYRQKIRDHRR